LSVNKIEPELPIPWITSPPLTQEKSRTQGRPATQSHPEEGGDSTTRRIFPLGSIQWKNERRIRTKIGPRISKRPKPTTGPRLCRIVRGVFVKAGLAKKQEGQRRPMYDLRPHSLRKYFRTQLTALGVPVDYVEFWMGHKISTYHDIEVKGIEFLRNIYTTSGFGIRPKAKVEIYDVIEEMLRAKGYLVDKDLLMRAVSKPHRTVVTADMVEEDRKTMLRDAFMEMLREEFQKSAEVSKR